MIPKKVKQLLPEVAIKRKEDLTLMQKLVEFYWTKTREALSSTAENKVLIPNLGTFYRKEKPLDEMIVKKKALIANMISKGGKHDYLDKDLSILEQAKLGLEADKDKKAKHKIRRNEYNQNLEKQKSDPGGD